MLKSSFSKVVVGLGGVALVGAGVFGGGVSASGLPVSSGSSGLSGSSVSSGGDGLVLRSDSLSVGGSRGVSVGRRVSSNAVGLTMRESPYVKKSVVVGGRTVSSCDDLVKVYRPAQLVGVPNVSVSCVNDGSLGSGTLGQISYYVDRSGQFASGPFTIKIARVPNMKVMVDAFSHEGWHAKSFSWSKVKQYQWVGQFGRTAKWNSGVYADMPSERWAWGANSCKSPFGTMSSSYNSSRVPGGCVAVESWLRN